MKRKIERDEDRERADEARLLRAWHGWHRAERKAVFAGARLQPACTSNHRRTPRWTARIS
jgi:hypothetical protein